MSTTVTSALLDERVAAARGALSAAEERVVDFIARHREEVAFLSAAEIARELATSDATVIRAAQSLGYSGLPELKSELQNALRSRATPALRLGRSPGEQEHTPELQSPVELVCRLLLEKKNFEAPPEAERQLGRAHV